MELKFVNFRGDELPLLDNPYFHLIDIDGQTDASTSISSDTIGGVDGDIVSNVQAHPRTVVLDLRIKSGANVEEAKRAVLTVVKLKKTGSLVWTQNNRTVTIAGVVEAVEMPRWNNAVTMQISLHCSQPFWEDVDAIVEEISTAIPLHYFTESPVDMLYFPAEGIPFGEVNSIRTRHIHNNGDVAVGLEIEILAYATVTNPIIYNEAGEYFGVGYDNGNKQVVMQAGDIVKITTGKGNKKVTLNGESLFGKIKQNSTWLQLEAGDNTFSVDSDSGTDNVTFSVAYKRRFI